MTLNCSICLTDLNSEKFVALCCGHIFHKSCLDSWLNSNHSTGGEYVCALCRKSTPVDRAIWPLYFTEAEDVSSVGSVEAAENEAALRRELDKGKESLSRANRLLDLKGDHLEKAKYDLREKTEEKASAQIALKYLKELRSVAELDRYMELPATQEYLSGLSSRPRPELMTVVGALYSRCAQHAKEKDLALEQKKLAECRAEALEKELFELKAESVKGRQVCPGPSFKHGKPSSSKEIISICSDEDTDDEGRLTLVAPRSSSSRKSLADKKVNKSIAKIRKGKEVAVDSCADRGSRLGFLGEDGSTSSPVPLRRSSRLKRDRQDDDLVESVSKTRRC